MVVIDRSGRVAYMGAIDDTPCRRQDRQELSRRRPRRDRRRQAGHRRRHSGLRLLDQIQGDLIVAATGLAEPRR